MSIYQDSSLEEIYQPYTYLIGWSHLDTWYYGSETGKLKCAKPTNLWTTYFTSSRYVKEFRELHGDPDVIEVRKVFVTADAALLWEHKVLMRLKASSNTRWLNKHVGGSKFTCSLPGNMNPSKLLATRKKISNALKGRKFSASCIEKMRLAKFGKNKGKTYEQMYGEAKAQELRMKRSLSKKGVPKSQAAKDKMRDRFSKLWKIFDLNSHAVIIKGLHKFCLDNKLDTSTMWDIAHRPYNKDGSLRWHKGFRVEPCIQTTSGEIIAIDALGQQGISHAHKKYKLTWPNGEQEQIYSLPQFAREQGWPEGALYDIKDRRRKNGALRKYKGCTLETLIAC
jgi:hypothetical protein